MVVVVVGVLVRVPVEGLVVVVMGFGVGRVWVRVGVWAMGLVGVGRGGGMVERVVEGVVVHGVQVVQGWRVLGCLGLGQS